MSSVWDVLDGRPVVYVWWRGTTCLYVGKTVNLKHRWHEHHILGGDNEKIEDTPIAGDRLEVHLCATGQEAIDIEAGMYKLYKPKYNRTSILERADKAIKVLNKKKAVVSIKIPTKKYQEKSKASTTEQVDERARLLIKYGLAKSYEEAYKILKRK